MGRQLDSGSVGECHLSDDCKPYLLMIPGPGFDSLSPADLIGVDSTMEYAPGKHGHRRRYRTGSSRTGAYTGRFGRMHSDVVVSCMPSSVRYKVRIGLFEAVAKNFTTNREIVNGLRLLDKNERTVKLHNLLLQKRMWYVLLNGRDGREGIWARW